MRDSDWSRQNLLRSDWLGLIVATITTPDVHGIKRTVRMFMLNGYKHLRFYLKEEKKSPNKYMYILSLNIIIVLCPEEDRINSA